MSVEVVVALISAGVAVCSAAVTAYATARSIRLQHALALHRMSRDRQEASEDLVRHYREPLLVAAFDLQTRIGNIVQNDFAARHMGSADPEEHRYARTSTLYRIGEYFGWIEILRRGLQFLNLGEDRRTHELVERLDLVSRTFADTQRYPASAFRLFRDEQRALGEVMLEPTDGELRRYQCIGYATFAARLETDTEFARWFHRLGMESDMLANPVPGQLDRLIRVQHALIDIINFLDPEGIRFSKAHIKRLDVPELAVEQKRDSSAPEWPSGTFHDERRHCL